MFCSGVLYVLYYIGATTSAEKRDQVCGGGATKSADKRDRFCGAMGESATTSAEVRDHFCGLSVQPIEITQRTYPQNATTSAVTGRLHRRDYFCGAGCDRFCGMRRDHFCGATALNLSIFNHDAARFSGFGAGLSLIHI